MTTINRDVLKQMDIDSILNLSADQVSDVQELVPFPTGFYAYTVTEANVDEGTESSGAFLKVELTIDEVIEINDPAEQEEAPEAGAKMTSRFYPGFTIEAFKTTFADLAAVLEEQLGQQPTIGQILGALEGTQWNGLIERRTRKDKDTGETKTFSQLNIHHNTLMGE